MVITITEAPILALVKTRGPFILKKDASDKGMGAVLSQRIDWIVIAYAS